MNTHQDAMPDDASTTSSNSKWNLHDTQWVLSLFGTAVGLVFYSYQLISVSADSGRLSSWHALPFQ